MKLNIIKYIIGVFAFFCFTPISSIAKNRDIKSPQPLQEYLNEEGNKRPDSKYTYIEGVVLSKNDSSAVSFATVYLEGTTNGTLTDDNGHFSLRVPLGAHKLGVSLLGYEHFSKEIAITDNRSHNLKVILEPSSLEIDESVISCKSETKNLQEKGFTVNSVSTLAAITSSFTTEELLNRSAGVKIRQGGGLGSDVEYNINGLSGSSVKVYIDGMPISTYGKSFSIANLPPSLVERIEVYKGVIPAHLADDALGGAINVITKKKGAQSLNASYGYGSLNTHNANINGIYRSNKSGFYFGGSAYYNSSDNNYDVWGDAVYVSDPTTGRVENITAERFHDDYLAYGTNINTGFSGLSWADNLSLNLVYSNIDKDIQTGATMETVYGNRRSEQDSYIANLNYEKNDLLPRLDLKSTFSVSHSDRMIIDTCNVKYDWSGEPVKNMYGETVHWATSGEAGRATLASNLENNFTNRTSIQYAFDKRDNHIFSLNGSYFGFTRDVKDPMLSALEQSLTETRYVSKYTFSAAYDARLFSEKLKFSLFYKYFDQTLTLSDPLVSSTGSLVPNEINAPMNGSGYGLALSYKVLPDVILSFSAENTLRLPSITEMIGNTSDNIEPNYNIKPEESININLGATIEPIKFGNSRIGGSINLFYRDVTDMIQRAEVNQGDETYGYENIGKILSKGIDFELKYDYGRNFSLNGAISYNDTRFNVQYDDKGGEYAWYGDRLRNMPYFLTNVGASYNFNDIFSKRDKLTVSYHLNYIHEFFKNWESLGTAGKATIPSQLTHDISIVYKFPNDKFSIGLDAKNITNEQLFDNYALQKPGRMIFIKLSYNIL